MRPSKLSRVSCESEWRATLKKNNLKKFLLCKAREIALIPRDGCKAEHVEYAQKSCFFFPLQEVEKEPSGPGWRWPHRLFSCVCRCFTFALDFVVHGSRGGEENWEIWAGWKLFRFVALSVSNLAHPKISTEWQIQLGIFKTKHSSNQIISSFFLREIFPRKVSTLPTKKP